MPARASFLSCAAPMEWGGSRTERAYFSAGHGGRTAQWLERTVVRRAQCFSVPEGLDDDTAAAIPNPGVSAWLSLKHSAKLASGETVLILGATGVTGKLAVQVAKIQGAGRVVAAGRNEQVLSALRELGADATIQLEKPHRNSSILSAARLAKRVSM